MVESQMSEDSGQKSVIKRFFELPATFEITVYLTDGDTIAKVSVDLPFGVFPSVETIKTVLDVVACEEEVVLNTKWRLCTPYEFGREIIKEKTGQSMVIPGANEWAEPYKSD